MDAMRGYLRNNLLWIGFGAVVVPLAILLVLQYRWLTDLQRASADATRAGMKSTAVAIAERVSYAYGKRVWGMFEKTAALMREDGGLDKVAYAVGRTDLEGVRRVFVATFDEQSIAWIHRFDPATGTFRRGEMDDEMAAIHVAIAPYKLMAWAGAKVERPEIEADSKSRAFPMAVYPMTDAKGRVRGVVGLIADVGYVRESIVPRAVTDVLEKYWGDDAGTLLVAVGEENADPIFAIDGWDPEPGEADTWAQLPWMFSTHYVVLKNRAATPEELANASFATNLTLSGLLSLALIGGLGLAIRTAVREKRLSNMKTDFVSNVSHELRTPLASIRVFGEFLGLGRVRDPDKIHEYGEYIESESRRLTQLINNILDFSKIESGAKTYRFETTDVREVLDEVLRTFEVRLRHSGFTIRKSIADGPISAVSGDPDAIAQALHNLLDNAVKYSNGAKTVEVAVDEGHRYVRVSVRDHGIGIARDEQDKIFERFHRVGTGLVHDVRGNGLGLSIVKHVVRAHGGKVTVESEPGKGTTFTVHLPREGHRPALSGPVSRPATTADGAAS